jgi:hypothetical protein
VAKVDAIRDIGRQGSVERLMFGALREAQVSIAPCGIG